MSDKCKLYVNAGATADKSSFGLPEVENAKHWTWLHVNEHRHAALVVTSMNSGNKSTYGQVIIDALVGYDAMKEELEKLRKDHDELQTKAALVLSEIGNKKQMTYEVRESFFVGYGRDWKTINVSAYPRLARQTYDDLVHRFPDRYFELIQVEHNEICLALTKQV